MKIILTNMCMLYDNKGNILVQERVKNDWPGITFPGGHIERDETIIESVIREIREETGYIIKDLLCCGIKEWLIDGERHLVILFKTDTFQGSLHPSKEGEVFWIKEDDLLQYSLAVDTYEIYEIMKYKI